MATYINDLHSAGNLVSALDPTTISSTSNGSSVDLIDGDGACFAIQHVGDLDDTGTLDGHIEQSADGSTWSAISGAAFDQVTAANNLQVITFRRTSRYLRWSVTIGGEGSPVFTVGVVIGEQKKTF